MADDIAGMLAAATAPDPARPLLTWYDDATGERTELSGTTLRNWVAKTGNLLVDELALGPGDTAGVLLPPHWQTAAVLLGCWSAGLTVVPADAAPPATAPPPVTAAPSASAASPVRAAPPASAARQSPVDVLFAAADRIDEAAGWPATERYALALAPLAAPLREVPDGFADYVIELRGQGDHFSAYPGGGPQDARLRGRAAERAAELGLRRGDRALIDAARHPDPVDWLLAPLSAGASVVLCGRLDPAQLPGRRAAERVTVDLA